MTNLLKKRAHVYLASALLPMAIMAVVWAFMGVFPFGNKTLMAVDFGQQYIGLYAFLKNTVLTGDFSALFYSFSKSIGGAMIGIWGFNLISPFNLIYILLPLEEFRWAITLTIWLRYGATALAFAHLLIRRYQALESNRLLIPLLSTAYAMCGFIVSYQMNPIFYDGMIMLPLVVLALEEVLDGQKAIKYSLILATSLLLHFYMGYMTCLFVALYAFYYQSRKVDDQQPFKAQVWPLFKPIWRLFLYSLLAIGLVMVLLFPIFLNLLRSKGAYESSMTFSWLFQINPFDILSKFYIGAFDNESWPAGPNLPNLFVGAVALFGAILYFFDKAISWTEKRAAGLVYLFFFMAIVHEFTNKIWHMGQTPAGFFYRFSWIVSFFMVLLAYRTLKNLSSLSLKQVLWLAQGVLVVNLYILMQTYTFLPKEQWLAASNYVRDNVILVTGTLLIALNVFLAKIWKRENLTESTKTVITLVSASLLAFVGWLYSQGHLFNQQVMTTLVWFLTLYGLYRFRQQKSLFLLLLLTVGELGVNAYISQSRIGYSNASQFRDAQLSVMDVVDTIRPDETDFYRINRTFIRSKNDPFMYDYPGNSHFSSNMERSTLRLFSQLGDSGSNASSYLSAGNLFTDALFNIRYMIDRKPYTNEDVTNHPERMYFGRNSYRPDLSLNYDLVAEFDRYEVYENKNYLPLAFGVSDRILDVVLPEHKPDVAQTMILSAFSGQDEEVYKQYSFSHIDLTNFQKDDSQPDRQVYNRVDTTQEGKIVFRNTMQQDSAYYLLGPMSLKRSKGKIPMMLNGQWFEYTDSYDMVQMWHLANQAAGQEVSLQLTTTEVNQLDLTGMHMVRADEERIGQIIADRRQQGMTVTKWSNTSIEGEVTITDDSQYLMTSIPYNPGWTVTVDGQKVEPVEVLESLMAIPITSGKHQVKMTFLPSGFKLGLLMSSLSAATLAGLWWLGRQQGSLDSLKDYFRKDLDEPVQ